MQSVLVLIAFRNRCRLARQENSFLTFQNGVILPFFLKVNLLKESAVVEYNQYIINII